MRFVNIPNALEGFFLNAYNIYIYLYIFYLTSNLDY